jgi:hypothetical protein
MLALGLALLGGVALAQDDYAQGYKDGTAAARDMRRISPELMGAGSMGVGLGACAVISLVSPPRRLCGRGRHRRVRARLVSGGASPDVDATNDYDYERGYQAGWQDANRKAAGRSGLGLCRGDVFQHWYLTDQIPAAQGPSPAAAVAEPLPDTCPVRRETGCPTSAPWSAARTPSPAAP